MYHPVSVSLTGPVFSFLLYETSRDSLKQYGFLLGEIVHKETTSITDNEQKQVEISKIININSVVPCLTNKYFSRGKVDKEKLRRFLGPQLPKVVAWYKYEQSSMMRITLKDRILHKQFQELFDVPDDLFTMCFLTSECTENFSSYNYQQNFLRFFNGSFEKLNFSIPNLSESNHTYKDSEPASEVFSKILSSIQMDLENTKGVVAIIEIENAVQNYIDKTANELAEAEKAMFCLEQEVQELQKETVFISTPMESEEVKNEENGEDSNFEEPKSLDLCREGSPEVTRRERRTRSKSNSSRSPSVTDSNRRNSTRLSEIQKSPEAVKKSPGKMKGRGRGSKKKV